MEKGVILFTAQFGCKKKKKREGRKNCQAMQQREKKKKDGAKELKGTQRKKETGVFKMFFFTKYLFGGTSFYFFFIPRPVLFPSLPASFPTLAAFWRMVRGLTFPALAARLSSRSFPT
jgi:hypothetical protein